MTKKVKMLDVCLFSIKASMMLLFFFVSSVIIQKAYADIVTINQLRLGLSTSNEVTSSKLGLEPNTSYYRYYLIRALEEKQQGEQTPLYTI